MYSGDNNNNNNNNERHAHISCLCRLPVESENFTRFESCKEDFKAPLAGTKHDDDAGRQTLQQASYNPVLQVSNYYYCCGVFKYRDIYAGGLQA